MNVTLSTFMKLAVTAIVIGALIIGVAVTTITTESGTYRTSVTDVNPPAAPTLTP